MMRLTVAADAKGSAAAIEVRDADAPQKPAVTEYTPGGRYDVLIGLPVNGSYMALRAGGAES